MQALKPAVYNVNKDACEQTEGFILAPEVVRTFTTHWQSVQSGRNLPTPPAFHGKCWVTAIGQVTRVTS